MAAALVDEDQQILLAQRHADAHQGGLWEFPGGKLEAGETPQQCLQRELNEELGIHIIESRPLIKVHHQYDDRSVILDVYKVTAWQGEPKGLEGQPLDWVHTTALNNYPMPAADVPIVKALQLPSEYLISPPEVADSDAFLRALEISLQQGIKLFQFRVFGLTSADKRVLAQDSLALCQQFNAVMLVNSDLELWQQLPAAGLHLNRKQLLDDVPSSMLDGRLLAASCHNIKELQLAEQLGVDFAVLSPVRPTQSHPDADVIGWANFSHFIENVGLPVFALGGMNRACLNDAWAAGAQGIAGIRMMWGGQ